MSPPEPSNIENAVAHPSPPQVERAIRFTYVQVMLGAVFGARARLTIRAGRWQAWFSLHRRQVF